MNKLSLALIVQVLVSTSALAAPITPVCERTPRIAAELVRILEKPCAEITTEDLLEVDGLFLDGPDARFSSSTPNTAEPFSNFKPGDLSGLDNLMMLSLNNNKLELEEVLKLKELPNLRFLSASNLKIYAIQAGLFDSFPKLEELNIGTETLEMIEPYAFAKSATLRKVDVSNTRTLARTSKAAFFGVEVTGLPSDFAVDPSRTKWK